MTMEEKIDMLVEKTNKIDMLVEKTNKIDMLVEKTSKIDMLVEKTSKIDMLIEKTDKLERNLNLVQKDIKELRQDHENMNRALILIEDDTSNKIPALFDGYSFHQQHIEEDEKRLDVLESEVDEHSIRISALEQVN